jgi:hypothetical protein
MNLRGLMVSLLLMSMPATARDIGADPMRPNYIRAAPEARTSRSAPRYRLQAIFGNDAGRVAVVNGQVLRAGDRLGGVTLRRIGATHAELQAGRTRWILRLPATPR